MGACDTDHCGFKRRWFIVGIERCAMGSIETVNQIKLNNLLYLTIVRSPLKPLCRL